MIIHPCRSSICPPHHPELLADKSKPQSVEFHGDEKQAENRGPARRSALQSQRLITEPFDEAECGTIWGAWQRGAKKFPERNCLSTRPYVLADGKYTYAEVPAGEKKGNPLRGDYKDMTYGACDKIVQAYGAGLASLGVLSGESVAIYSINRAEWSMANVGNFSQGYRTVALYDTLGADAAAYIVGHADCKAIVCSKDKIKKVFALCKNTPQVKTVVQFDVDAGNYANVEDTVDPKDVEAAAAQGLQLLGFSELCAKGAASGIFPNPPKPDDLAYIMYTSGTTGMPKGAMLTHRNIMSASAGALAHLLLKETDVHVSYLPLAHIFETVVQVVLLCVGGRIAFFQGDVKKLPDDFKDAAVTMLVGVPRVYERIYERVQSRIGDAGCLRRWVANKAFREQAECIRQGTRDEGWDTTVFIPMRTQMGLNNVRVTVSGAAPMAAYLAEFLRIVVGAPVCQGYGMTETSAASCIVGTSDVNVGHVGGPLQCLEVCLEDVPDMSYSHKDTHPRGEILMRGPSIFMGYFKNEEATRDALTADGWLHSGDVGRWNPNGTLSIIDRKKNMLKLSQGEYIALEKVEAAYKNPLTSQLCVYGNSYHSFIVAIAVPNAEHVLPWLVQKGWWPSGLPLSATAAFRAEFKTQCVAHEAELSDFVHAAIIEQAVANKLSSLEKIKKPLIFEFDLDDAMAGFNVENDCLTPTMKMKRNVIVKRYEEKLKSVYEKNGEPAKAGEKW